MYLALRLYYFLPSYIYQYYERTWTGVLFQSVHHRIPTTTKDVDAGTNEEPLTFIDLPDS